MLDDWYCLQKNTMSLNTESTKNKWATIKSGDFQVWDSWSWNKVKFNSTLSVTLVLQQRMSLKWDTCHGALKYLLEHQLPVPLSITEWQWKSPSRVRLLQPHGLYSQRRQCHPTPVLLPGNSHGVWWAAVHGVAEGWTQLSNFTFTFHFHALEKEMATHSSVLAWRIPGTGEPGGLPSMGSHRVRHG